jgi:hypothetical protein
VRELTRIAGIVALALVSSVAVARGGGPGGSAGGFGGGLGAADRAMNRERVMTMERREVRSQFQHRERVDSRNGQGAGFDQDQDRLRTHDELRTQDRLHQQ